MLAVTSLLAATAPAVGAAETDEFRPGRFRQAFTQVRDRQMPMPEAPGVVALHCAARTTDAASAVGCEWRSDTDVRSWQLWNLQVRPTHGNRNLVAEVGADSDRFVDRNVDAPARYLYAVLGLDGDGEIIARSRVQVVDVAAPQIDPVPVNPVPIESACAIGRADDGALVGCEWRPVAREAGAAGYVVWRQTNGGEREAMVRLGLDVTAWRDLEVAPGNRYGYTIVAVNADGDVVGQSRVAVVGIPERPEPPTDVRPFDAEPVPVRPAAVRPATAQPTTDGRG